jgi:hypothetical protein
MHGVNYQFNYLGSLLLSIARIKYMEYTELLDQGRYKLVYTTLTRHTAGYSIICVPDEMGQGQPACKREWKKHKEGEE